MLPSISASTPLVFHPDDDQAYALNFTQYGIGTRTITSVDGIVASPTGPVFADLAANAGTVLGEKGQTVAIGKAATFSMSGGAAAIDYECTCTVTYSDGSEVNGVFKAQCRAR